MPLSKSCSSKPKTNKSEKSIPPTTTKKFTISVKKNSKSTPKKGAVKKVPIPSPKRVTRSASRFAPKGKKAVGEVPSVTLSSDSSDSYESAEDELYRPGPENFENSSDDDSDSEVAAARPRELKMKKNKAKGKICFEDLCEEDEMIVSNSDEEVDLGQVIGKANEVQPPYDAFDEYHDDSYGNDSWKSEEMTTPPNSDKESDADDDDAFPMFMEGARFGELKLEVGMKFNSKHDFIEAMREFTIQKGRQINFKRNESYRVRAVCKYKKEGCKCIAYASMGHEETCWQMKIFNNNHICARRTKIGQQTRSDEEPSGSKKSKTDATKLPKKYKEFSCAYCGAKGHTKRSCSHRKADDIAAALTTAATAVIAKEKEKGSNANKTIEGQSAQDGEAEGDPVPATHVATSVAPTMANAPSEIVLSQTPFSQLDNGDQEQITPATRYDKLQPKRKAPPVPGSSSVDPLQGASAGTSLRMAEFMKFVPTPGVKLAFKPPRKK
ncbi:hypothetical protein Ahy_B01g055787 [Arachis hypogaea]|uniref:Transposase MuDR plant domain-containing protein n=1 Tax=Arachis hypogaea TaxID=3818 RepID=A0A445AX28_ARAHY|nr:hypothetical protein Ahy_B01g055787 [Arachis hypogaea]